MTRPRVMKRPVRGETIRTTNRNAMVLRALGGQTRADEPPAKAYGYNRVNPEPDLVFSRNADGELVKRRKSP